MFALSHNKPPQPRPYAHLGPAYDDHHFTLNLGSDYDRRVIDSVISWARKAGIDPETDSNLSAIRSNVGPVIVRINGFDNAVAFHEMWLRNIDHL